jgi:protein ImuB
VRTAAGPDRVSGGQWEDGYAREYFRALGEDGTLVWLYRDGVDGGWYLHGWWD